MLPGIFCISAGGIASGQRKSRLKRLIQKMDGGQGGIRTLDRVTPMPVFETGTFNHSVTCPHEGRDIARNVGVVECLFCFAANRVG